MKNREPRTRPVWTYLCLLALALLCTDAARARVRAAPLLSISDASVGEGDGRADDMVFVITLSEPSAQPFVVGYETQAGTATPGSNFSPGTDYNQTSGQLTIPAGSTWALLPIQVVSDTLAEPNETFSVVLKNFPEQIADGVGVGTIIDDDGAVFTKVQMTGNAFTMSETAGKLDFQVTRTGDLSAPSAVSFWMAGLGASERSDFTQTPGILRFAPNETSKTFTVSVSNDAFFENDEQFFVAIFAPVGCTLGSPAFAIVTLTSDDAADGPSPVGPSAFDAAFFVRQHYLDFLGREPDAAGLQFWQNEIAQCGTDAQCAEVKKVNVSAAFFLSIEFQNTGFLVYKAYKTAFGNPPDRPVPVTLGDFLYDTRQIGRSVIVNEGDWRAQLEQNKRDYFDAFVRGTVFQLVYPQTLTPEQFVNALDANAGGVLTAEERTALASALTAGTKTRAEVLRAVAENPELTRREFNRAFVLMQYFGYLRRNPDEFPEVGHSFDGYNFWLGKLDEFKGDYIRAEMVKAFIQSDEYVKRFGR